MKAFALTVVPSSLILRGRAGAIDHHLQHNECIDAGHRLQRHGSLLIQ